MPQSDTQWLVNRITFGSTAEELALAESLGYEGYLEHHLDYTAIDDSALDARLAAYPTLTMEPWELVPVPAGEARNALIEACVLRSVFSKRQLFERMVEFWTDHFNIDIRNGNDQWLKTVDDREVVRAHALGSFPEMLSASAHSPAMLVYLDNNTNLAGNPNENYARELMELHTMGVDGGFTQRTVEEVARCFTGWTTYGKSTNPESLAWSFRYRANRHDDNAKVLLGQRIRAGGGINDGLTVLDILATHPSTARFIARKLSSWFWGYDPPDGLVDSVASTYTVTGGDIKAMLRTLFMSGDAMTAPPKYKRPLHLVASAPAFSDRPIFGKAPPAHL